MIAAPCTRTGLLEKIPLDPGQIWTHDSLAGVLRLFIDLDGVWWLENAGEKGAICVYHDKKQKWKRLAAGQQLSVGLQRRVLITRTSKTIDLWQEPYRSSFNCTAVPISHPTPTSAAQTSDTITIAAAPLDETASA